MRSEIFWIELPPPGRLAIAARPRSGDWLEDEIAARASDDVNAVVSLLEPHEVVELALDDEPTLCRDRGLEFLSLPMPDRGVPHSVAGVLPLIENIDAKMSHDGSVLIHCRAGIRRSALFAACVLAARGLTSNDAFERIAKARGARTPDTDGQKLWVDTFCATFPDLKRV
jgi:protein-tyrosine phosphatase